MKSSSFSFFLEYALLVTFLFPLTLLIAPYVLAWDFFKNIYINENIPMCTAEVIVYVEGNWYFFSMPKIITGVTGQHSI